MTKPKRVSTPEWLISCTYCVMITALWWKPERDKQHQERQQQRSVCLDFGKPSKSGDKIKQIFAAVTKKAFFCLRRKDEELRKSKKYSSIMLHSVGKLYALKRSLFYCPRCYLLLTLFIRLFQTRPLTILHTWRSWSESDSDDRESFCLFSTT